MSEDIGLTFYCGTQACPGHKKSPFCGETAEDVIRKEAEIAALVHLQRCSCIMQQEEKPKFSLEKNEITCPLCKIMLGVRSTNQ